MSQRIKDLNKLKNILQVHAIYSGDLVESGDGSLYFYSKEYLSDLIDNIIFHFDDLLEENDKLVGENVRLKNDN